MPFSPNDHVAVVGQHAFPLPLEQLHPEAMGQIVGPAEDDRYIVRTADGSEVVWPEAYLQLVEAATAAFPAVTPLGTSAPAIPMLIPHPEDTDHAPSDLADDDHDHPTDDAAADDSVPRSRLASIVQAIGLGDGAKASTY